MRKNKNLLITSVAVLFSVFISGFSYSQGNDSLSADLTRKIDKENIFSQSEKDMANKYSDSFSIDPASIKTELKEVRDGTADKILGPESGARDLQGALVNIDTVVNIAKKIWDIIKDNQPVSNIENLYAVAYPAGVTAASQLDGWSKPKVYVYGFYADNLYGIRVIDVEYRVIFNYGGTYKGKGKYLTGVSVVPTKADVAWGYRFNMNSYVPDSTVVNVGTSVNPDAGLQLKLTWKISTYLKDSTNSSVYYIQGDGYYSEIASPFKGGAVENSVLGPYLDGSESKVFVGN